MIISEKQVLELVQIAGVSITLAIKNGEEWDEWAHSVATLIDEIHNQQSNELKAIE